MLGYGLALYILWALWISERYVARDIAQYKTLGVRALIGRFFVRFLFVSHFVIAQKVATVLKQALDYLTTKFGSLVSQ